jgi:hypothetical protein
MTVLALDNDWHFRFGIVIASILWRTNNCCRSLLASSRPEGAAMNRTRTAPLTRILAALCAAIILPGLAGAAALPPVVSTEDHGSDVERQRTVQVAGVNVQIDEQTGRLRTLTPAQSRELAGVLQNIFGSAKSAHQVVTRADGTTSLVLDERYANFSIALIDEKGNLATSCVSGAEQTQAVLGGSGVDQQPDKE